MIAPPDSERSKKKKEENINVCWMKEEKNECVTAELEAHPAGAPGQVILA